ncbi:secreted RxLR effector protein 161-like [Lactuca sativa]|uniref:secreted RxLR effector protein 161-like n=1 Tax=Lactuca sativa TaxID=4236 RepID=UPI000CD84B51|nr:secreted RxLR effector protein 161-like [Lactuca sativa]
MLGCKPVKTPLEVNFVFSRDCDDNSDLIRNITELQKLLGKLIYLTVTRPDNSYAVQVLSQFMHKPRKSHLNVAFRLLRYLKECPGKGVVFSKSNNFDIIGYVDADWAKCLSTRRSVCGYLVYLGSSLISWKSKKQSTVSRSSTESEYRALGSVTCEVLWILKVLSDIGFKI